MLMGVWDLGATKCAVAIVEYGHQLSIKAHVSVPLTACESLDHLLQTLQAELNIEFSTLDKMLIAAAGIYDSGVLHHTVGYPYAMNFAQASQRYAWPEFSVVHDYVPHMCSTFVADHKNNNHVKFIHDGEFDPFGRRVVFGIGTGFGLKDGVLFPSGQFWCGQNEIGHMGLPIPPEQEPPSHQALMYFLRANHTPLTIETLLSGNGLSRIHEFITGERLSPESVGDLIAQGAAHETHAIFAWYLGLVIGCIQLVFMPSGGIWMTGGVLLKHRQLLSHPKLFSGIEASPAYRTQRLRFPLALINDPSLLFLGGAYYLQKN